MSDPAIEAAQRADEMCDDGAWIDGGRELSVTAAREALAPIRELHKPSGDDCQCCTHCIECEQLWPCGTARLIYTTEELQ